MSKKLKVVTDLDSYTEDEFYKATSKINKSIALNIGSFTGLPSDSTVLGPLVEVFNKVRTELIYEGKGADIAKARTAVQVVITQDGNWLNDFCDGDASLIAKSGYPVQKDSVHQTKLDATILTLSTEKAAGSLGFMVSFIDGYGIKYGIMYTLASNLETDPSKWTFYYAAQRTGIISGLISKTDYKFASFAMGTVNDLTYSDPVTMSAQ